MAQRDYAARRTGKANKKKNNTPLILTAVLVIIALFAGGLYFLKEKSTEIAPVVIPQENKTPKSVLPTPPEEVWSYIKALETRTVPVDNNPKSLEKNMRLTDEQKKVLIEMEKEQKAAEAARLKQAQAEAQKQAEVAKDVEQPKMETVKTTKPKPEVKPEPKPVVEAKKVAEPAKKADSKPAEKATVSMGEKKFGLQCGAFKNRQQAENIQAKLVMSGFNARVSSSADWNRVFIGPVGERASTALLLEKAKAVTPCVMIGM